MTERIKKIYITIFTKNNISYSDKLLIHIVRSHMMLNVDNTNEEDIIYKILSLYGFSKLALERNKETDDSN